MDPRGVRGTQFVPDLVACTVRKPGCGSSWIHLGQKPPSTGVSCSYPATSLTRLTADDPLHFCGEGHAHGNSGETADRSITDMKDRRIYGRERTSYWLEDNRASCGNGGGMLASHATQTLPGSLFPGTRDAKAVMSKGAGLLARRCSGGGASRQHSVLEGRHKLAQVLGHNLV